MKKTVIGIIAHVDSGKTTLSEAMLYLSGKIRKVGRVDHGDAFLDTDMIEKYRGITVFSKPAEFEYKNTSFTLLDTPGHVDFSAETERALQVLDLAVLVISGTDGVQSHTQTLWRLLKRYNVPAFVFVNKMDLDGADKTFVMNSLEGRLGSGFVDFCRMKSEVAEDCALFDENIMNEFLETGSMSDKILSDSVAHRKVFPCFFGSALKSQGIEKFMNALAELAPCVYDSGTFGAKVYKISEDGGSRLTFMKITGGCLKVRDLVDYTSADGESFSEKVSRIRIYSGAKYRNADNAETGVVCAVEGLTKTYAGQGFGFEQDSAKPLLEPVLTYRVEPVCDLDMHTLLSYFRVLENEDPQLHVDWNEQLGEIHVSIMGEVQLEILKSLFKRRFDIDIDFGEGSIAYKETIAESVYGYGHYEPLRHYAEVHLKLEPLERGKCLRFATECSEDTLDKNWQRLILTHLQEKKYLGVLTGSAITDMKITLVSGRAHLKHTEGGDFRQATYRAVRQGLRNAKSVLLEPYYSFTLEVPQQNVGRAITDIQNMGGVFSQPEVSGEFSVIKGSAPVAEMRGYQSQVISYTKGVGKLICTSDGYRECHNTEVVLEEYGYDPDRDLENTADSVFCSHGAGYNVKWNEVPDKLHIPPEDKRRQVSQAQSYARAEDFVRRAASDKELMEIFERTYGKIVRDKHYAMRRPEKSVKSASKPKQIYSGVEYLLVDGYNIIFSWDELKKAANESLDLARSMLVNRLCNYQGYKQCELILVFDAYKVKEQERVVENYHNISIVYTKEAETADTYIERTAHKLSREHKVRVATSDGMEQVIIMGSGAFRMSAQELHEDVIRVEKEIREYISNMK